MAWGSTAPIALSALLATIQTADGLAGVDVRDGPTVVDKAALEVVSVGYAGGDEELDIEAEVEPEGMAASPDRERYTIQCAAAVLNGAGDISAARSRVFELLAACGAAIARDRTLGGTVLQASVGSWSLRQTQDDRGATAMATFGVAVDAFTV
ncbi:hypothetical protein [Streptomyces sp. 891-h]|uniref:hypothetical protein n=1 Tax=Streptomyces sp. 891-h TaxID=2720714 RepID=UPI001FAA286F|nr:hypothetical protein [Streptomyces sp. 891-h]UNZ20624.1 hypothetical protein HC362_29730 [Streptomyces sp. 891-h]